MWGLNGVVEFNGQSPNLTVALEGDSDIRIILGTKDENDYLKDLIHDIRGEHPDLDTVAVIRATRDTLSIQKAADDVSIYPLHML